MRHRNHKVIAGVDTAHRKANLSNLAGALFIHGRITTTLAKAKALRPYAERLITKAKKAHSATEPKDKLHYRRQVAAVLHGKEPIKALFDNKVSEFIDRKGGYTRIYKLVPRLGDAADMAIIELIKAEDKGYSKPKKKAAAKKTPSKGKAKKAKTEEAETPAAETAEVAAE